MNLSCVVLMIDVSLSRYFVMEVMYKLCVLQYVIGRMLRVGEDLCVSLDVIMIQSSLAGAYA